MLRPLPAGNLTRKVTLDIVFMGSFGISFKKPKRL
jgi:hypothetical protein